MIDATEIAPKIWHSNETGMVMLDIGDVVGPVEPATVQGIEFIPKHEYHTTLVSVRRELPDSKKETRFVRNLTDFLTQSSVEVSVVGYERYLCQKDDEATIIAPVHLFGEHALKAFVREFIPNYDPFYHVTLLKNEQTQYGIRISSHEDLNDRCALL